MKMEDIKKFLEQNEGYLLSSSDENETDNESPCISNIKNNHEISTPDNACLEMQPSNSIKSIKRNGEKRMPTRRPDPNVYNRNALLARENRRKKKMYLETIEKELQDTRKANRVLAKALKRQLKIAERLQKEKKYFEGLIMNGSRKLTPIDTLSLHYIPETESDKSPLSSASNNDDFTYYSMGNMATTRSLGCSLNDGDALSIQFDSTSDDLENEHCLPSSSTTWDNIWGDNGHHIDNLIFPKSNVENGHQIVNNDHNYITPTIRGTENHDNGSESSDYIDVEYDSLQMGNWNYTARTPPLQLLSNQ